MKTRRSRKSFEMPSRKKRRRMSDKGNPLKAVNETIVLSDSESESEIVPGSSALNVNDDDIEVIEVLDVTQRTEANDDTILKIPEEQPAVLPSHSDSVSAKEKDTSGTADESSIPLVNVEDDAPAAVNTISKDDDGVEFLGFVVTSKGAKRKSSFGGDSRTRSIKKALKDTMRRSSINNGSRKNFAPRFIPLGIAARVGPLNHLNSISNNSHQIRRKKQKNKRNFQNNCNPFRPAEKWNIMNRNRVRENCREILFRPDQPSDNNTCRRNEVKPWIAANTNNRNTNHDRVARVAVNPSGSNIMMANDTANASNRPPGSLRPIVIDGSNIAVGHGDVSPTGGHRFSPRGIQICVEYFRKRGHTEVIAFVPRFRLKQNESRDQKLLESLEKDGCVRFTPSRDAGRHRITSYDDLFVIQYANETGGIIISNDNFRDIYGSNPQLQETITLRQLMFTWVTPDVIMFPQDPLGAGGPTLDEFLKF